jgi:hypothetical protein
MAKFLNKVLLLLIVGILIYVVAVQSLEPTNTQENTQKYIANLKEAMMLGEEELVVKYVGSKEKLESFVTNAVEEAFVTDDRNTSDDYDYLKYKYAGVNVNMQGYGRNYQITYSFSYLESKEETDVVNSEIKKVLLGMDIENQSDYKKIKLIHDYIVINATYDLSTSKNAAYHCLIEGTSACQGYASLFYKMMTEAGIPCRIIAGKGMNESHAWNIVKLNDYWYNIDCTWDDPIGTKGKDYIDYKYFLKNESDFTQHIRDKVYTTEEFRKNHIMAENSY